MGRPPWATPEQLLFMGGFLPGLDQVMKERTLTSEYAVIAEEFIQTWPVEPTEAERKKAKTDEELKDLANERRSRVSQAFCHGRMCSNFCCQQIREWFKARRRTSAKASEHKALLDLSGSSTRKPHHLQFHQAYSVRYYRPEGSPLRDEVQDLWERRHEKSVIDKLAPYVKKGTSDTRLNFHKTIMLWKCSTLSEEERRELAEWATENARLRQSELSQPWIVGEDDDELRAENEYIQRCAQFAPSPIVTSS